MIYFIGEPDVNQACYGRWSGPRPGGGDEMVLELAQVQIKPVGDGGFEQATEAFDRIEFGTVGRQR